MLTNSLSMRLGSHTLLDVDSERSLQTRALASTVRHNAFHGGRFEPDRTHRHNESVVVDARPPSVHILPSDVVRRRTLNWHGMGAEFVEFTSHDRVECHFRAPVHLLIACEQGVRREGETFVDGLPRSTLRDFSRKLIFVPAGHEYREWQEPRTLTRLMYFYLDPATLEVHADVDAAPASLAPRLFFEDATLWETALKLKRSVENPTAENRLYSEALGVVLVHELMRLNRGVPRVEPQIIRGGLAAWQQKTVTTYIEEHLAERIPLAELAQLARLSPYYFCRAFKQSFGMPPHRYHTNRRIEQAKALLAKRTFSVTDIGLMIGFSETSSFTAAFRKVTGTTPSTYHRTLG
jgi:AraC family transcriptional regulator